MIWPNFLPQYLPFTPRGLCGKHQGGRNRVDVQQSVDRAEPEESGLLTGHFRAAGAGCCPNGARLPVNGAFRRGRGSNCGLPV
ncbi:MAG: hypothetical protein ACLR4Z_08570 [Butyricicoccaceae bacterium]